MRFDILIGGKAGQGIDALSQLISAALVRIGYYVFNYRDYQSLIQGGHNFNIVCFSEEKIGSHDEQSDILVAFDENTYRQHKEKLKAESIVLTSEEKLRGGKTVFIDIKELGKAGNVAFLGALAKILGIEKKIVLEEMEKKFKGKNTPQNKEVLERFYSQDYHLKLGLKHLKEKGELRSGSEAIVKGAIESELERYFGYPMTPATGVLTLLAQKQKEVGKLVVLSLESEISVINAALGASFAGRRVMTGTSGGGFDLMTEGVSMGGMMELPLVVHLAQRTGPSTGVPTYTGQADLNVALYGGHGDFLRVVIAPGDAEEAYRVTKEAFYLAEKLGLVVILLTDKHLVESVYTSQQKKNNLKIPLRKEWAGKGLFKRNSYEHDLEWNTTEEAGEIKASVERREKKRELLGREIQNFERYKIYGKGKKLLVGFGSTKGAVLDALKDLPGFGYLHLIYLEPFPEETLSILKGVEEGWVIEGNVGGQLAELIARKTGYKVDKGKRVLKYDARPFTPEEIIKKVREIKGAEGK